jgi:hypothetical protein
MSPVDVDRFAILGHIRTSGIVILRGITLRSTRYTEGPDRCSLTLSIVRLIRTECTRGCHGKCLRKVLSANLQYLSCKKEFCIPFVKCRGAAILPFHPKQTI